MKRNLEKALGYKNLVGNKTQYYYGKCKKKKTWNTRL